MKVKIVSTYISYNIHEYERMILFLQVFYETQIGQKRIPPPRNWVLINYFLRPSSWQKQPRTNSRIFSSLWFLFFQGRRRRREMGVGTQLSAFAKIESFAVSSLCFRVFGDSAVGLWVLFCALFFLPLLRSLRDLLRERLSRGAKKSIRSTEAQHCLRFAQGKKVQYADAVSFRNGHFLGIAG